MKSVFYFNIVLIYMAQQITNLINEVRYSHKSNAFKINFMRCIILTKFNFIVNRDNQELRMSVYEMFKILFDPYNIIIPIGNFHNGNQAIIRILMIYY